MPELLTREPSGAASRPPSNRNGGRLQPGTVAGFTSENMAGLNRNLHSILHLLGLELPVPDHSTIGRRARTVKLPARPRSDGGPLHLLVDSTGLKLGGPGEWLLEKHGTKRRRSWRVLHLGMDAASGRITAATLTDRGVDDATQVGPPLDQVADPVASLMGDGALDHAR